MNADSVLNLHHFKIFFARAALRAGPVHGDLIPRCSGGYALLRRTSSFVVNPSTNQAHPSLVHSHVFQVNQVKPAKAVA